MKRDHESRRAPEAADSLARHVKRDHESRRAPEAADSLARHVKRNHESRRGRSLGRRCATKATP